MERFAVLTVLMGGLALAVSGIAEDESAEAKIARAMSAAPSNISANATIIDMDGTVLREGTNGWTCQPGVVPGDDHPMCNDAVWMKMMMAVEMIMAAVVIATTITTTRTTTSTSTTERTTTRMGIMMATTATTRRTTTRRRRRRRRRGQR